MNNLTLDNLKPNVPKKPHRRRGRGNAAGLGTYAGKGIKGQHARAGNSHKPGFEGGRTTLIAQTPKMRGKGFRPLFAAPQVLDVSALNIFEDGQVVTLKLLQSKGLVDSGPVKILGGGEITKKLEVKLPVSQSAAEKIRKAGGTVAKDAPSEKALPTKETK